MTTSVPTDNISDKNISESLLETCNVYSEILAPIVQASDIPVIDVSQDFEQSISDFDLSIFDFNNV